MIIKNKVIFLLMLSFALCINCEIITQKNTIPTVVLFSHGIADTYKQAFWYARSYIKDAVTYYNNHPLFHSPFITFNYPDATEGLLRVNYKETSFGQENEINRLLSAYNNTVGWASKKWNNYNIILFGLSRGASNVGIFAGLYYLPAVKAIILESPYLTMDDIIENIMEKNSFTRLMPLSYGQNVAEFIFKRYKRNGMTPLKVIENIPQDMPIFIICSKEDQLVPFSSSVNFYKKLINSDHQHTYILILDHGRHAKILSGPDGEKYYTTIHAFYKKYNLPYDSSAAEIGEKHLVLCQPHLL